MNKSFGNSRRARCTDDEDWPVDESTDDSDEPNS